MNMNIVGKIILSISFFKNGYVFVILYICNILPWTGKGFLANVFPRDALS